MQRPPCWAEGKPCPNPCAAAQYQRTIYNQTALHGPWSGWRMAGQRLVSPDREWIAPYMLDRILYHRSVLFDYATASRQKRLSGGDVGKRPAERSKALVFQPEIQIL